VRTVELSQVAHFISRGCIVRELNIEFSVEELVRGCVFVAFEQFEPALEFGIGGFLEVDYVSGLVFGRLRYHFFECPVHLKINI